MRLPAPKVHLLPNWRDLLRHAWSVRLLALAALLTFLEVVLNLVGVPLPSMPRALVMGAVTAAAFVSRLLAQKHLSGEPNEQEAK